jgi:hypothetical protein
MALSDDIRTLESENERLLKENEELRKQQQNPAVATLLDLLEPEFAWQEEHWKDIGKWKQARLGPMIKAFRELRPKE